MKTMVAALFVLIFSQLALADCGALQCVDVKITRLYVKSNGDTVFSTSGDESKLSCDAGTNGYIRLNPAASNYQSTYALLLAAHTTEHPIWVRASGTTSCSLDYVVSD